MTGSATRVLIVDDEPLAREGVRGLLTREAGVEIVGECGDGHEAVDALRRGGIDVVFLDVEMPGMDGFGVLEALAGESLPVVVFVTAHNDHALRAFEANALDYVLKPFSDDRFKASLDRARRRVHERRLGRTESDIVDLLATLRAAVPGVGSPASIDDANVSRWPDRIAVRSVGRTVYVRVADVVWIGSADYYVELHTTDGKSHLVRESMQRIEQRLDPSRFVRAHRTAIVSLDHVVEIRSDGADRQFVLLRAGIKLPLGKARRDAVERALASR